MTDVTETRGGFQVMPPLSPDERAELEASILINGVQVPITVGPDGTIVDGHHRDEIARKHDLHCPRVTAEGDEAKLRGLAFSLNLHRRHLTREQKRALVAESIKADPQLSDREHGRRTGTSQGLASRERSKLEQSDSIDHFSERIDPRTGNASQPATKPRPAPAPDPEAEADKSDWFDQDDAYADVDTNAAPPEPPAPTKPRRRPITDQAQTAGWELIKAVERIQRIAADDRFEPQKEKVTPHLRGHLINTINACQDVLDRLPQGE